MHQLYPVSVCVCMNINSWTDLCRGSYDDVKSNGDVCVLAGSLSEEGLLLYLGVLQTLLPLLPVSENSSRPDIGSDSEDDDDDASMRLPSTQVKKKIKTHTYMLVHKHKI